jgi:hypothetical protein
MSLQMAPSGASRCPLLRRLLGVKRNVANGPNPTLPTQLRHWRLKTLAAQKHCSRQGLREPGYVESARRRCSSTPAISARMVLSAVVVKRIRSLRVFDEASFAFPAPFGPAVFITLNVSIADAKAELLVTQVVRKSAVASTIMLYHDVNRLKQPLQNISEGFSSYTP